MTDSRSTDKIPEVRAGRPMLASEQNRFIRSHNASLRDRFGSFEQSLEIANLAKSAEILTLNNVSGFIECIEVGVTGPDQEPFDVRLPQIYREAARGTVSYVYTSLNQRTASGPAGPNETQFLTPALTVGERILIIFNDELSDYEMVGDGRMWAVDP